MADVAPRSPDRVVIAANAARHFVAVDASTDFDALYTAYAPLLRRIAIAKFDIPTSDVDELVHDVFLTYLINPAKVRDVRPYLIGGICNAAPVLPRSCATVVRHAEGRRLMSTGHPLPDLLLQFALDASSDIDGVAAHVEVCAACAAEVEHILMIEAMLSDRDAWAVAEDLSRNDTPRAETLRAFDAQLAAEDAEAKRLLKDYIDSPAALIFHDLSRRRKHRTAGVARLLCNLANQTCERDPLAARNVAHAAIRIADTLSTAPRKRVSSAPISRKPRSTGHQFAGSCT